MPDPVKLLITLEKALQATRNTPGRLGHLLELSDLSEMLVAGDLHGHIPNFQAIYKAADLLRNPRRHLVLQELIHSQFRYPGGGDKSHQLLDLFCALKNQFPSRVHLLPGNHEIAQMINNRVMKNDEEYNALFIDGIREAYGSIADDIYAAYLRLIRELPLAIRLPNRVFISHSLPAVRKREQFLFGDLLLENPPETVWVSGGSYHLLVWGRDTSAENASVFLEKVQAEYLISGHIVCDPGYDFPSANHLIVDCSHSPAAIAMVPADRALSEEDFRSVVKIL